MREAALYYNRYKRAKIAQLLDHFHGPHVGAALGSLTDRQLALFYFHPRDKDTGAIIKPRREEIEPETLEKVLRDLCMLKQMLGPRLAGYDEAVRQAYLKFGQMPPQVVPEVQPMREVITRMPIPKAWRR